MRNQPLSLVLKPLADPNLAHEKVRRVKGVNRNGVRPPLTSGAYGQTWICQCGRIFFNTRQIRKTKMTL